MMNALPSASNSVAGPSDSVTPVGRRVQVAVAVGVDDEVRQVAGMRAVRVLEAVLVAERVVVAAGGGEGRRRTDADGVDVDAVQPGGQALDLDVDVDVARAILA